MSSIFWSNEGNQRGRMAANVLGSPVCRWCFVGRLYQDLEFFVCRSCIYTSHLSINGRTVRIGDVAPIPKRKDVQRVGDRVPVRTVHCYAPKAVRLYWGLAKECK